MDLNADINDGLNNEGTIIDIVPNFKIAVEANVSNGKVKSTLIPSIEGIVKKSVHLQDLIDIRDSLNTKRVISRDVAKTVDQFFGKFFGKVSIEEFTPTPTKVNYEYTLNFINKEINATQLNIAKEANDSLSEELVNLEKADGMFEEKHIDTIIENVSEMLANNAPMLEALSDSSNTVFPIKTSDDKTEFINIATSKISTLSEVNIISNIKSNVIKSLFIKLNENIDNIGFISLAYIAKKGMTLKEFYSSESHAVAARANFEGYTLLELVDLYRDHGIITVVTSFKSYHGSVINLFKELIKSQGPFTVSNLDKFKGEVSPALAIQEMLFNFENVTQASKELFVLLSEEVV